MPQAKCLVHVDAPCSNSLEMLGIKACGREVLNASWVVARVEVIRAVGDDLYRGERTRTVAIVDHGDRELDAIDILFDGAVSP